MQLKAAVDVSQAVAGLNDLQKTQIPFALAKTLTGCAKVGQIKVQESLGGKFTLRSPAFMKRGIRIKPAEKNGAVIEADVHTDFASHTSAAPDFMIPQEEGGEKVPHGGRQFLAVPTRYLRQMAPGIIPAELRPKALLGAVGGRYAVVTRQKGQIALRNQQRVRGFDFFLQDLRSGRKAIMGRYFTDRDAYPFYLLIPDAHIKPRLEMQHEVEQAARAAFPELWAETWRSIMGKGLKIKF